MMNNSQDKSEDIENQHHSKDKESPLSKKIKYTDNNDDVDDVSSNDAVGFEMESTEDFLSNELIEAEGDDSAVESFQNLGEDLKETPDR